MEYKFKLRVFLLRKLNHLYNASKKRGLSISLTHEELLKLYKNLDCYHCQTSCTIVRDFESEKDIPDNYATLDRLDNLSGYHYANLVISCYRCNQIKAVKEDTALKLYRKENGQEELGRWRG